MSGFEAIDWYDTPRYYDLIFDEDTQQEANFVEAALERYGPARGRRVLEPACGSGRMALELARRGFAVEGFDASLPMLEFARQRLSRAQHKARLRQGQLETYHAARRVQLAHCLVSTFKYVLDEAGAHAHLQCIAGSLVPGGLYLLGLHLTDYAETKRSRERWVVKKRGLEVICNTQTWPANRRTRLEQVRTRLRIHEKGREQRSETNWRFRTYNARELRRLIAKVPAFELLAVHDFHYDIDWSGPLVDEASDVLLVLRRR